MRIEEADNPMSSKIVVLPLRYIYDDPQGTLNSEIIQKNQSDQSHTKHKNIDIARIKKLVMHACILIKRLLTAHIQSRFCQHLYLRSRQMHPR